MVVTMNTEQKVKAYDEAIEKAKEYFNSLRFSLL